MEDEMGRCSYLSWTTAIALIVPAHAHGQSAPTYEKVCQIGVVSGAPEYVFGRIADVAFGVNGEIVVLDNMHSEVRVFDADGRFLRTFGRSGEGPGEFLSGTRLLIRGDHVIVLDPFQRRLVTFTHSGEHVDTRRLPEELADFDGLIPMAHDWWVVSRTRNVIAGTSVQLASRSASEIARLAPGLRDADAYIVAMVRSGFGAVDTVQRYDHGLIKTFTQRGGVTYLRRNWGHGGGWSTAGDSILVTVDAFVGQVRILRVGPIGAAVAKVGRLQITPRPLGPNDWKAVHAALVQERQAGPAKHLEGPRYQAQLGEPVISDDGVVWIPRIDFDPVSRRPPAATYRVLLLPIDGREQTVVTLPSGLTLRAVRGDVLVGTRKAEYDVPVVEVWARKQ
jgi:hypothetical protein